MAASSCSYLRVSEHGAGVWALDDLDTLQLVESVRVEIVAEQRCVVMLHAAQLQRLPAHCNKHLLQAPVSRLTATSTSYKHLSITSLQQAPATRTCHRTATSTSYEYDTYTCARPLSPKRLISGCS